LTRNFTARELAQAEKRFKNIVLTIWQKLGPDVSQEVVLSVLEANFDLMCQADPAMAHYLLNRGAEHAVQAAV
jgi:hypothetical protein